MTQAEFIIYKARVKNPYTEWTGSDIFTLLEEIEKLQDELYELRLHTIYSNNLSSSTRGS